MLVIIRALGGEFKVSTLDSDINFSCKSALSYSKLYLLDIYPYLLELNVCSYICCYKMSSRQVIRKERGCVTKL